MDGDPRLPLLELLSEPKTTMIFQTWSDIVYFSVKYCANTKGLRDDNLPLPLMILSSNGFLQSYQALFLSPVSVGWSE